VQKRSSQYLCINIRFIQTEGSSATAISFSEEVSDAPLAPSSGFRALLLAVVFQERLKCRRS
jgi:hypothetical protein